jgi:hypothetical protein
MARIPGQNAIQGSTIEEKLASIERCIAITAACST